MIKLPNFQPVKYAANRHSIGGVTDAAFVAKRGQIVQQTADGDGIEIADDGKAGYFLTRDVMLAADLKAWHDANELRPNKAGFTTPFLAGQPAQAEDLKEIWVEGTDLLDASIDENTAVDTALTTDGGKFAVLTDSEAQECIAIVRAKVAALNDDAPAKRFLLEIVRAPKNIPAV
jgi:hypothetical protein